MSMDSLNKREAGAQPVPPKSNADKLAELKSRREGIAGFNDVVAADRPILEQIDKEIAELEGGDDTTKTPEEVRDQKLEALYTEIRQKGPIKGSLKTYTPDELIELIKDVRKENQLMDTLTTANDIRKRVRQILS